MAPSNGMAVNANGMKRSAKVVPAIPLALSKRPARPQPKPETSARAAVIPVEVAKEETIVEEAVTTSDDVEEQAHAVEKEGVPQQEEQVHELEQPTKPYVGTPISRDIAPMELPHDITPDPVSAPEDVVQQAPALTNGHHTETSSPTIIASPVTRRKTSDRFDMRHIRTELPPAFVPSAERQRTPHSANSSFTRPYQPGLPHGHPTHPSAGSIVFGSQDSATSSPAPPLSGSAYPPPPQLSQPPFFGHAHHPSDPQRMGPPNGFVHQQSPMQNATRQRFGPGPSYHPHAHMPAPYTPREPVRPAGLPLTNGHGHGYAIQSRSASQASSSAYDAQRPAGDLQSPIAIEQPIENGRPMFVDQKSAFSGHGQPLPHQQMGPPRPDLAHPAFANDLNAVALRDHVFAQFQNPDFVDCSLEISDEAGARHTLESHKLVLARSSTLLSIIRNSEVPASAASKAQVQVELRGQHVAVGPFMDAVRFLYGGSLPDFDVYRGSNMSSETRLDLGFKYIATGAWLNLTSFAHRGVEICSSLLHWETIPSTLAFALEGGLGQMWPIKDGLDDNNEEKTSTCSSDDSFNKPEAGGSPRYDPYSSALLHRALDYIVNQFPPNFYLDQAAPQLAASPRLPPQPSKHESKPSRSDPRLSNIRFGDLQAAEDHQRPSYGTTNISSILLSLPFPLLKFLLEHPLLSDRLGSDTVGSIMRQVVSEREVRRQKALAHTHSVTTGGPLVQNLFWEELVEVYPQNKAGSRLARRRRGGIDTPPSDS